MYAQANQNWTSKTKQGFWLTLLAESLHQRSTAKSAEKLLRVGPSLLTSSKSLRVKQLRFVLLSFLMIFEVEKKRSTLAVKKGKLKSRLLTNKMFVHSQHQVTSTTGARLSCNYHIRSEGKS